ncbi:MAG: hypothetical protein KKB50_20850 [Planctomycetes bacterium]|nr:hypothetical protein [Planctomycetota bacterium]
MPEIEKELREIIPLFVAQLPSDKMQHLLELVQVGEPGIALEDLEIED